MAQMTTPAAPLRLKKGIEEQVRAGFPWVYADDIIESSQLLTVPSGAVVAIENAKGQSIGLGYYNAKSQIACRVLTIGKEQLGPELFRRRIKEAAQRRETMLGAPYYRLAHSESDFLPGLLIDRFAGYFVIQVGTAGMERLSALWLPVIEELFAPSAIILRNDIAVREREGLKQFVEVAYGDVPPLVEVHEHGTIYLADLIRGQKTGWFYDQRDNRKMMAELSVGKSVLDVYSHSGGFALRAAKAGASSVTLVDSSKLALELAAQAGALNGIADKLSYEQGDAFEMMQKLASEGRQFDVVIADPPAFVKHKKDMGAGLKGYEKVARLAASLVAPGGKLFVASCSHHALRPKFNQAVIKGAKDVGFPGKMLKQTGAAPDHPVHKLLPQGEYLKGILLG